MRHQAALLLPMLLLMLPEGAFETRPPKKVFTVSVFYDSTYPHASDFATYSSEIVNRQLGDLSSFELAVNLHRVGYTDAYRLARLCTHQPPGNSSPTSFSCPRFAFPQVCSDISQGRIAIIAIGISPSFRLISAIAANLVSPFPQRPLQTLLAKSSSLFSQNVPYLTVSPDLDYSSPAGPPSASAHSSPASHKYQLLHMHPPVSKLMSSLVDLVEYYKWE